MTINDLIGLGVFTQNPAAGGFAVPGDAVQQPALGYLHANCGNCHNDTIDGVAFPYMDLWIKSTDVFVAQTGAYTTAISQMTTNFMNATWRVLPGDPSNSCVSVRMQDPAARMPPIGSEVIDAEGVAIIDAWINSL